MKEKGEKSWEAFRARQMGRNRQPAGCSRWAAGQRDVGHLASLPSAVSWHCPPASHSYPSTISKRCLAQTNTTRRLAKQNCPLGILSCTRVEKMSGNVPMHQNVGVERHLLFSLNAIWQLFYSMWGECSSYFFDLFYTDGIFVLN